MQRIMILHCTFMQFLPRLNGSEQVDITRKTDYALRMLAMLIENEGALLSVRVAAEQNDARCSVARSSRQRLVHAGIIESLRGVHGGMRLKVDPSKVTLKQVVEAVQGPFVMNDCCADGAECSRSCFCQFHPVWVGVQSLVSDYLSSVTLEEVVKGTKRPRVDPKFTDPDAFPIYAGAPVRMAE